MSDSAFFISAAPGILSENDEKRLSVMFRRISVGGGCLEPIDWMERKVPEQYLGCGRLLQYGWEE